MLLIPEFMWMPSGRGGIRCCGSIRGVVVIIIMIIQTGIHFIPRISIVINIGPTTTVPTTHYGMERCGRRHVPTSDVMIDGRDGTVVDIVIIIMFDGTVVLLLLLLLLL